MSEGNEPMEFDVVVVMATDAALLCNNDGDEQWIPVSQIHDDSEIYHAGQQGEAGTLVIPRWLAEAKGWA